MTWTTALIFTKKVPLKTEIPEDAFYHLFEMNVDGTGVRQLTRGKYDDFDGRYLPDGRIVFASTASYTGVPCWHGKERACSLYSMNDDGSDVRQLCFDQDLDLPSCLLLGDLNSVHRPDKDSDDWRKIDRARRFAGLPVVHEDIIFIIGVSTHQVGGNRLESHITPIG